MSARIGPSTLLAGRYQLERVLGSGGMGVVYRARDLLHEAFGEPDARVALKLLGETLTESCDGHVLLYSEFALTRSLRHEHVVRLFTFEVDTACQAAFFTMELLQGLTLDRLLLECPDGLPWHELQPLALQLLDAAGVRPPARRCARGRKADQHYGGRAGRAFVRFWPGPCPGAAGRRAARFEPQPFERLDPCLCGTGTDSRRVPVREYRPVWRGLRTLCVGPWACAAAQ